MWCHPAMVYEQDVNMFVCSLFFLVYPIHCILRKCSCKAMCTKSFPPATLSWPSNMMAPLSLGVAVVLVAMPLWCHVNCRWQVTNNQRGRRNQSEQKQAALEVSDLAPSSPGCLPLIRLGMGDHDHALSEWNIESYRGISTFIIYLKCPLYVTILTFFSDFGWEVLVVFRPWHIRGSSHRVPVLRSKPLSRMALAIHEPTGFSKSNLYDGLRLDPQRLRCIRMLLEYNMYIYILYNFYIYYWMGHEFMAETENLGIQKGRAQDCCFLDAKVRWEADDTMVFYIH